MKDIKQILEEVRHELVTLHGLIATDIGEVGKNQFKISTTETIKEIDDYTKRSKESVLGFCPLIKDNCSSQCTWWDYKYDGCIIHTLKVIR